MIAQTASINHDWVWPIGYVDKDYDEPLELCGMLVLPETAKFDAPLVGLLVVGKEQIIG